MTDDQFAQRLRRAFPEGSAACSVPDCPAGPIVTRAAHIARGHRRSARRWLAGLATMVVLTGSGVALARTEFISIQLAGIKPILARVQRVLPDGSTVAKGPHGIVYTVGPQGGVGLSGRSATLQEAEKWAEFPVIPPTGLPAGTHGRTIGESPNAVTFSYSIGSTGGFSVWENPAQGIVPAAVMCMSTTGSCTASTLASWVEDTTRISVVSDNGSLSTSEAQAIKAAMQASP